MRTHDDVATVPASDGRTESGRDEHGPGERFHAVMAAVVRRLPFGLSRVVAPSFLGFALINGFTFAFDLALLTAFRGLLGWRVSVSFTLAYLLAFGLSFLLNRTLNFRSHAPIGPQAAIYLVAIGLNYVVFILGVGGGLAWLGMQYHLARVIAGMCEAAYMYSVMRWVVFREARWSARPIRLGGRPSPPG